MKRADEQTDPILERFLGEAASMGRLDSEGSFTLAGAEAVRKLASFQLPRPTAWILKILQTAVCSGAPELSVRQCGKATRFTFSPLEAVCLSDLKSALLDVEFRGSRALGHLATGLRAVGFGDSRPFTLAHDSGRERHLFGWNGEDLALQTVDLGREHRNTIHLGVSFPPEDQGRVLGGLARGAGRAAYEYQELRYSAQASPIPIRFDGRRLDTMLVPSRVSETVVSTALLSLGWFDPNPAPLELREFPLPMGMVKRQAEWRVSDRFTDPRPYTLVGNPDAVTCRGLVKVNYHYEVPQTIEERNAVGFLPRPQASLCHWLIDGAICSSAVLAGGPDPISVELFLEASDLPTDLTGLSLLEHGATLTRQSLSLAYVREQMDATIGALSRHIPKPFARDILTFFGVTLGTAALLPLGALGLVVPAISPILVFSSRKKGAVVGDCLSRLRAFRNRLPSSRDIRH